VKCRSILRAIRWKSSDGNCSRQRIVDRLNLLFFRVGKRFTSFLSFIVLLFACASNCFVFAFSNPEELPDGSKRTPKTKVSTHEPRSRFSTVGITSSEYPILSGLKRPELIPARPFRLNPVRSLKSSVDPVRFILTANKTAITVGEEIELTIRAELLDIPPSLLFFFEEQKSFSLKLLLPDGFEITGGTYTDFIGTTLDLQSKPAVEYTVKGKFTRYTEKSFFTLLR
jgi:hypothetical protein